MSKKHHKKYQKEDNFSLILFRIDKLEEEELRYHREHMTRLDKIQEMMSRQNEIIISHGTQITSLEEKIHKIEDVNEELQNHSTRLSFLESSRTTLLGLVIGIGTLLIANVALELLKIL